MDNEKFIRYFMILDEEDKTFSGKKPSGYVKIEALGRDGKLTGHIKSLKTFGNTPLYLYLVSSEGEKYTFAKVAESVPGQDRWDIKWNFDSNNVADTRKSIASFDIVAVVSYDKNYNITIPLSYYRDKKVNLRSQLKADLTNGRSLEESGKVKENVEIVSNEEIVKEVSQVTSVYNAIESSPEFNIPDSLKKNDIENEVKVEQEKEEDTPGDMMSENIGEQIENEQTQNVAKEEIQRKDTPKNPCAECDNVDYIHQETEQKTHSQKVFDVDELVKALDNSFEQIDPFNARRRDYRWWKVVNPMYLSNVLYENGVKIPLIFNPAVMNAHYRYGYIIAGIYEDLRNKKNTYFVCGVPGLYKEEERPFGQYCRWVRTEMRQGPNAMGYWLIYSDIPTGRILKLT